MSILSVYFAPEHNRPGDHDYIRTLQPPFVRVLQPDVAHIAMVHQLAPNAVILPRIWDIDDNNKQATRDLMANPATAGLSWANRYAGWVDQVYDQAVKRGLKMPPRSQLMFCAANEPNEGGDHPQIAEANLKFARQMSALGLRALVVVWGPGHPNPLPVEDTWRTHYDSLLRAVAASQTTATPHMVELHEYWRKEGPFYHEQGRADSDWTWLAGRVLRLPYDVPVLIGECGVEGKLYNVDMSRDTGWLKYGISPETYAQQITDYIRGLDPRVKGVMPFLTDYRDNQWHSFDTHTAHGALLARRHLMVPQGKPLTTHTTHIPVVIAPGPTPPEPPPPAPAPDNFKRALAFVLRWEGQWADNPNDPGGATMQGITLATFTRWRHAQGMGTPSKDDLRNIKPDERDAIYYQWYWLASGSHELAWPLCLAQFDTAVNAGVGRAAQMLGDSDGDFVRYMGLLINWYTRIPNWEHFGVAWIRRRADLLVEAAK